MHGLFKEGFEKVAGFKFKPPKGFKVRKPKIDKEAIKRDVAEWRKPLKQKVEEQYLRQQAVASEMFKGKK